MQLVHGGDTTGNAEAYGREPLDFSANINPLGLPESVRRAVAAALGSAEKYPDPLCRSLRRALAQSEGVPPEHIVCGNGAADLIFRLALAFRPQKALLLSPTFAEYEAALRLAGSEIVYYDLRAENGFAVGEDILAAAAGADMIFLCQPNNPTGRLADMQLARRLAQQCAARGSRLVADECFCDFLDEPERGTLKSELAGGGLLILKAFTKIYAMPGIRLGYCLCGNAADAEAIFAAGQPWNVSSLAEAAGIAALGETDYVCRSRALIRQERQFLADALAARGLRVFAPSANFIFFDSGSGALGAQLRMRGVLLRDCANYRGLRPGYWRAAVRSRTENEAFLAALDGALAQK